MCTDNSIRPKQAVGVPACSEIGLERGFSGSLAVERVMHGAEGMSSRVELACEATSSWADAQLATASAGEERLRALELVLTAPCPA